MTTGRRAALALGLVSGVAACAGALGLDELSPRPAQKADAAVSPAADATDAPSPAPTDTDPFAPPAIPRLLASKWYHTCAARQGGRLFCFGHNAHGELGDRTTEDRAVPTAVWDNPVVEQVATGLEHTCILQKAGVVRCWGSNSRGQLGDGSTTPRAAIGPAVIGTFSYVSTGMYHTCALTPDNEVRCWGDNYFGSVGDGTRSNRSYSTAVAGVANVVSLATGGWHSCAAVASGSVYCWGYNRYGQLGYATSQTDEEEAHSETAVVVPGIDHVIQVTAGEHHTCALRDDGTIWCWGRNDEFALGDGTDADTRISPTQTVGALAGVASVVAGAHNTCARLKDGSVRCWGRNPFGELATGAVDPGTPVPGAPIAGLKGIELLTVGDHACAFDGELALECWGRNDYGQLGFDTGGDSVSVPTIVPF